MCCTDRRPPVQLFLRRTDSALVCTTLPGPSLIRPPSPGRSMPCAWSPRWTPSPRKHPARVSHVGRSNTTNCAAPAHVSPDAIVVGLVVYFHLVLPSDSNPTAVLSVSLPFPSPRVIYPQPFPM